MSDYSPTNMAQRTRSATRNMDNVVHDNVVHDNVVHDNVVHDNVVRDNVVRDNVVRDNAISDAKVPTMRQCLREAFIPALLAFMILRIIYPNIGDIVDMFCGYVCMVLILSFIICGLINIASYMWTKITINDMPISRTRMEHTSRTGEHMSRRKEHAVRGEPRIRHNANVGGGAQFRGRRDLCGAVTMEG